MLYVKLACNNWLNPVCGAFVGKFQRPKQVIGIGDGNRRHFILLAQMN
jgi:hypothetical protein